VKGNSGYPGYRGNGVYVRSNVCHTGSSSVRPVPLPGERLIENHHRCLALSMNTCGRAQCSGSPEMNAKYGKVGK